MLTSPIVAGPLGPCSASVQVLGTLPGAEVHVWATAHVGTTFTSRHVGRATAVGAQTEVPLSSVLVAEERVVASQILGGEVGPEIPGDSGEPVGQTPRTDDLAGLFCAETLLDCATCFWVNGVVPGATVRVTINGGAPLVATVQTDHAKFTLTGGARLHTGDVLTAQQNACAVAGPVVSLASPVAQRRAAWPQPAPLLDLPLLQCQSALRLSEVLPGATVVVNHEGQRSSACFASSRGRFGLPRRLKAGDKVAVRQVFNGCELIGAEQEHTVLSDNPLPPSVVGPVCAGDRLIRIVDAIEGARIEIAADGRPLCTGIAYDASITVGVPSILGADELTVRQSVCDGQLGTWSDWSQPTPVRSLGPQSRPTIVEPLIAGGVAVGVVGLRKGAVVEVVSPFGVVGRAVSNGDQRVDVPLWTPLVKDDRITLRTLRCGALVSWPGTARVGAMVDVAPPELMSPACDCGGSVLVRQAVPGAIVEVYRADPGPPFLLLGTARAGDATVSVDVPPLSGVEQLVAMQRLAGQRSSPGANVGVASPPHWHYEPNSAFRLCQFTRDADPGDRPHPMATTPLGLMGTDLGVPVEHGGRLYLFFGDSSEFDDVSDPDPIAWMTTLDPDDLQDAPPDVHWILNSAGRFHPLTVNGESLGNFEVPTGAFAWDGRLYLFIARLKMEDPGRMTTSTLVVRHDTQWDFSPLLPVSSTTGGQILVLGADDQLHPAPYPGRRWMLHISPTVVVNADWPGLPSSNGHGLLLFGSSAYRGAEPDVTADEKIHGNVYLAWAPLAPGVVPPHAPIPPADQWHFFKGLGAGGGPTWSTLSAGPPVPVIKPDAAGPRLLGEFGVVWYPSLRRWVLAGTADRGLQSGTQMARRPWGPWTASDSICDAGVPGRDAGNLTWQWTDANVTYAPYLIKRWLGWDRSTRRARLHFTLSGFDDRPGKAKYQPQLVRSEITCWT